MWGRTMRSLPVRGARTFIDGPADNPEVVWREERDRYYRGLRAASMADSSQLSDEDRQVAAAHERAEGAGGLFYRDPVTKDSHPTRTFHRLRGVCCGNACRHCIYNYNKVEPVVRMKKVFNGAFWADSAEAVAEREAAKKRRRRLKIHSSYQ